MTCQEKSLKLNMTVHPQFSCKARGEADASTSGPSLVDGERSTRKRSACSLQLQTQSTMYNAKCVPHPTEKHFSQLANKNVVLRRTNRCDGSPSDRIGGDDWPSY